MTKRLCVRCNKNRSLVDKAGRAVFAPRGKICVHCRKSTTRDASKNQRLQKVYDITLDEYNKMFDAQGGRCAICLGVRRERLSVDHCHKTNMIRGLLCRRCNGRLLTAALDKPEVLRRAAEYLEQPPAVKTLGTRYAAGGKDAVQRQPVRRGRRRR